MVEAGQAVLVRYRGTLDDGTVFVDTMQENGPIKFKVGSHEMLPAFELAVSELSPGESCHIHIPASKAHGAYDESLVVTVPIASVPDAETLSEGEYFFVQFGDFTEAVKVLSKNETSMVVDCNHELAGKDVNYYIELLEIAHESAIEREHHAGCSCGCDIVKQQLVG